MNDDKVEIIIVDDAPLNLELLGKIWEWPISWSAQRRAAKRPCPT